MDKNKKQAMTNWEGCPARGFIIYIKGQCPFIHCCEYLGR